MVSQIIFSVFVVVLTVQRGWELQKSERNRKALLKRGGQEHAFEHFPYMALLHSTWLLAMLVEVWVSGSNFNVALAWVATVAFVLGQIFRFAAMNTLGERWCARIITLPKEPPIKTGIYRIMRHPNYIGVVIEIVAAPLIHSAFVTAIVFSLLNLWLLKVRISAEEKAVYG